MQNVSKYTQKMSRKRCGIFQMTVTANTYDRYKYMSGTWKDFDQYFTKKNQFIK